METIYLSNSPTTIKKVILMLFHHPYQILILQWNWKSAFLSATMRSSIFLVTYLINKEGLKIALGAMAAQFIFRTIFGGVNGTIIQSFRKAEPAWQSVLIVPLVLAVFSHTIEFTVQTAYDNYAGTTAKSKVIIISIIISIISAVFNLFVMRRGVFIVKDAKEQSLWEDMKRIPLLTVEFLLFPHNWLWKNSKSLSEKSLFRRRSAKGK